MRSMRRWIPGPLALDLRHAARGLLRDRLFSSGVVSTLALGIAASAVVASLVRGVLLRPLPYPEPERLVRVFETSTRFPRRRGGRGSRAARREPAATGRRGAGGARASPVPVLRRGRLREPGPGVVRHRRLRHPGLCPRAPPPGDRHPPGARSRRRSRAAAGGGRGAPPGRLGVGLGIVAALALGRLTRSLLFGVSARDPVALVVASATLLLVASLAALLSGWRAAHASPASVLRAE